MEAQIRLHLFKVFQCVYTSYQSVLIHSAPFSKGISSGQQRATTMEYSKLEIAVVSVWHQGTGNNRVVEIVKENSKTV